MLISDLLGPANVLPRLRAPDKAGVLGAMTDHASRAFGVDRTLVFEALSKREALGSTGMGGGVAMPHARLAHITAPHALLARLVSPVDFDAVDGRPVDLVLLLLLPAASTGAALNAMACAARCLRDPLVTAALRNASESDDLYGIVCGRTR